MKIIHPPALRKGDLLSIISPAGPVTDETRIDRAVRYLERLGYRVDVGPSARAVAGYCAGPDTARLQDLHSAFANKKVRGIICSRGGYGTSRLLPFIDYRLIARNPKVLVGYSDITALQLAFWKKAGLVTFHGPMAAVEMASTIDEMTAECFWRMVTSARTSGSIDFPPGTKPVTLTGGTVAGRLLGGNLSLLVSMMGTPFAPDFTRSILFFEEVAEEPYRIDRLLTQLSNTGVLDRTRGILSGSFVDCAPSDPLKPSHTVGDILTQLAGQLGKPFLSNLPFGHIPAKITLPIGGRVRLDATAGTLTLVEPPCA